jgi:hypothetical protein
MAQHLQDLSNGFQGLANEAVLIPNLPAVGQGNQILQLLQQQQQSIQQQQQSIQQFTP